MAELKVNFRGTLYDLQSKSSRQVFLDGDLWRSDVGIGGGPVIPPSGGGGGNGDHIWGPTDPRPTPPIALPPGYPGDPPHIWGPTDPRPTPPIYIPPAVPPGMQPPEPPAAGSPTTPVPGDWPVQPVTPPPYIIVTYPGIGPVYVTPPAAPSPS